MELGVLIQFLWLTVETAVFISGAIKKPYKLPGFALSNNVTLYILVLIPLLTGTFISVC